MRLSLSVIFFNFHIGFTDHKIQYGMSKRFNLLIYLKFRQFSTKSDILPYSVDKSDIFLITKNAAILPDALTLERLGL